MLFDSSHHRSATPPGTGPSGLAGGRARPLPPEQRRAMLIAATLPLVAEHGTKVTTRQIAEAAGVAEGTIFRVFPDKEALISAVVAHALDPAQAIAELRGVDARLPLRPRLLELTSILQRRLIQTFKLMIATCQHAPPEHVDAHRAAARPTNDLILTEIERILAPDRHQLRWPPAEVARLLRLLTFSGSHPMITDGNLLSADQIVEVLLDGVVLHPGQTPAAASDGAADRADSSRADSSRADSSRADSSRAEASRADTS